MGLGLAPLQPYLIVTNGAMAGTITSSTANIGGYDNVAIQLTWTGTPVGTFAIQASLDATNWVALTLGTTVSVAGAADTALIEITMAPYPYLRVVYTATSGTGTLNAYLCAKGT
jgi:hypothetical protein